MSQKSQTLQKEYVLRFSHIRRYRQQVWKILCSDYFSRHISPNSTVLDLGCGWGEFINNINVAKKYAMDLNPDSKAHLSPEVVFLQQDCSDIWDMPNESLDVVFSSNFLEHLPDKSSIERTIAESNRCLRNDGRIILLGPNIKYINGAYWDFWDHFIPLTEQSISEVLNLQGFEIITKLPRFLPYSMSTGYTPPLVFLRLYLRLPWIWPVFGKQFLVIAQKRYS
ncbi:class I SAM-dependent methyltransferase [Roseiflexus sp.]|uniref:class I SAM-dependent methyltransferase n=1 Tax=Roseiflexus sp. TaxID=2562120 RepID=UPI00398B709F